MNYSKNKREHRAIIQRQDYECENNVDLEDKEPDAFLFRMLQRNYNRIHPRWPREIKRGYDNNGRSNADDISAEVVPVKDRKKYCGKQGNQQQYEDGYEFRRVHKYHLFKVWGLIIINHSNSDREEGMPTGSRYAESNGGYGVMQ